MPEFKKQLPLILFSCLFILSFFLPCYGGSGFFPSLEHTELGFMGAWVALCQFEDLFDSSKDFILGILVNLANPLLLLSFIPRIKKTTLLIMGGLALASCLYWPISASLEGDLHNN